MERAEQMLEATLPPGVMVMAVRRRLRREVCLPSGAMAIRLLPRTMPGSLVLQ